MVTCPECGSDDLERIGSSGADIRRLRCLACRHEWTRGTRPGNQASASSKPGDPASVLRFELDDVGYEAWIARRPGAFVINTTRPPTAGYLMMHLANCFHISVPDHRFTQSSWTGNDYMKFCAPRRQDLEAWSREEFGRDPDRCSSCDP
jgi:hypothetical protein